MRIYKTVIMLVLFISVHLTSLYRTVYPVRTGMLIVIKDCVLTMEISVLLCGDQVINCMLTVYITHIYLTYTIYIVLSTFRF